VFGVMLSINVFYQSCWELFFLL